MDVVENSLHSFDEIALEAKFNAYGSVKNCNQLKDAMAKLVHDEVQLGASITFDMLEKILEDHRPKIVVQQV